VPGTDVDVKLPTGRFDACAGSPDSNMICIAAMHDKRAAKNRMASFFQTPARLADGLAPKDGASANCGLTPSPLGPPLRPKTD
jgi:hypothetical protein